MLRSVDKCPVNAGCLIPSKMPECRELETGFDPPRGGATDGSGHWVLVDAESSTAATRRTSPEMKPRPDDTPATVDTSEPKIGAYTPGCACIDVVSIASGDKGVLRCLRPDGC